MAITAITGNAGSGKSTATDIMAAMGANIISADHINSELHEHSAFIFKWLCSALDLEPDYSNMNTDSRKGLLRKAIFADRKSRIITEGILHPVISANINLRLSLASSESSCISEIPLLFEAGMIDLFDRIILIHSAHNALISRLCTRNNMPVAMVSDILESQESNRYRYELASDIIINNQSLVKLKKCIRSLYISAIREPGVPA